MRRYCSPKRFALLIMVMLFINSNCIFSQKVPVCLKSNSSNGLSFWRITDASSAEIISSFGHPDKDSVSFFLEANRLYSLIITVFEPIVPINTTYSLGVNGEFILRINEQLSPGDHEYKFFTGTRKAPSKIIGGTTASISEFPWQVYFRSDNNLCGGVIIDPFWIMTAAHCTEDNNQNPIPPDRMSIIAGTNTPTIPYTGGTTYYISQVIRHELFDPKSLENDIALLKLSDSITNPNSSPIKLLTVYDVADGADAPGVMATVTGWGLTQVSPPYPSDYLRQVQLPIVSRDQAKLIWPNIPVSDLMAGYAHEMKDACNGDSGGPLVVPVLDEYKVAGIVSWGNTNCDTYSGYTDVSAFTSWIYEQTGIIDFKPPIPAGNNVICNINDTSIYSIEPFPSGTNYTWRVYPDSTGTITADSLTARVAWNKTFSGQSQVIVRTTVNGKLSDWSKLKVQVAPMRHITSISKDTSICENSGLVLNVNTIGNNLNYRWYRNNTQINSQNSDTLVIQSAVPDNSGVYRCDVSNICGTTSSGDINVDIMPQTSINNVTPDTDIPIGSSNSLEVNATGRKLEYQWLRDGILIPYETGPTLTFYDVTANDIGLYKVIVNGECGTVTSDSIYVYVNNNGSSSADVVVWPTASFDHFNVAVNNDEPYTIQLFSSGGSLIQEIRKCRYQTTLYVGNLPRSTYFLKIFSSRFRKVIRVIKT